MSKIRLSDSETRLLLVFLAVAMLAAAYFLSFMRNVDLAREIEEQNREDEAYLEMLESMVARRSQVEAQTEEYYQTIEDIVAKYPPELPTEKAITVLQEIENRTGVTVNDINFSMDELIVSLADNAGAGYEEAEYAEEEYTDEEYLGEDGTGEVDMEEEYTESAGTRSAMAGVSSIGYRNTLSMNYDAEYSDFKQMVAYIGGLSDRMTIPLVTVAFDNETGDLSGSITFNMYYLTDTGREYDAPEIPGMRKGVQNIFRSGGGRPTAAGTAAEESEEENGEEQENEQEQENDEEQDEG